MTHPHAKLSLEQRFCLKFDKTENNSCWNWKAYKNHDGYGIFRIGNKMEGAHRVSFRIYHGEIPYGFCVCHRCDNPSCVNPSHLFLGTQLENIDDRDTKNRTGKGEKNRHAKLTSSDVKSIREMIAKGYSNTHIASYYPVDRSVISNIRHNKIWRCVQ